MAELNVGNQADTRKRAQVRVTAYLRPRLQISDYFSSTHVHSIYKQHSHLLFTSASVHQKPITPVNHPSKMPPQQGNTKKSGPVYFWKPEKGHGYLGQWYWSPWTCNGESYNSAEMWMMVGKARIFSDEVRSCFNEQSTWISVLTYDRTQRKKF